MAKEKIDENLPDISAFNAYTSRGFDGYSPLNTVVHMKEFGPRDPRLVSLKYQVSKSGPPYVGIEQNDIGFASFLKRFAATNITGERLYENLHVFNSIFVVMQYLKV